MKLEKIILKENQDGVLCLFDTRSEQFIVGACVKDPSTSDLVDIANTVVNKSYKNILETAQNIEYRDNGYVETMIASKYIELNPDIREKVMEKLNKPKVNKKMQITGKKRGRTKTKPEPVAATEKKKRGRPKKNSV